MDQYFAVIYSKNGEIHLWPGDSQNDCLVELRRVRDSKKWGHVIKSTTVIKRDMSNFKDGLIFGSPKSLNVMVEKKK